MFLSAPAAPVASRPVAAAVAPAPFVPKFPLGQVVITPGAAALLSGCRVDALSLLKRHVVGDWGELCQQDQALNNLSLSSESPGRLMSSYLMPKNQTVWIITEWDRSVTTLLLPSDY